MPRRSWVRPSFKTDTAPSSADSPPPPPIPPSGCGPGWPPSPAGGTSPRRPRSPPTPATGPRRPSPPRTDGRPPAGPGQGPHAERMAGLAVVEGPQQVAGLVGDGDQTDVGEGLVGVHGRILPLGAARADDGPRRRVVFATCNALRNLGGLQANSLIGP